MAPLLQSASSSLLVLPSASISPTSASIKQTYEEVLSSTLIHLWRKRSTTTQPTTVDIIAPCPFLSQHSFVARSSIYPVAQPLIASIYNLITIVAAQNSIELDTPAGIDARVLLLSDIEDDVAGSSQSTKQPSLHYFGPIISRRTLVASKRSWNEMFITGEKIATQLSQTLLRSGQSTLVHHLPLPTNSEEVKHDIQTPNISSASNKHHHVAVGGTFDHLHVGHKLLLTMTAFAMDLPQPSDAATSSAVQQTSCGALSSVTVGITGDELLKNKKYAEVLEDWSHRQKSVQRFLQAILDFRPPESQTLRTSERKNPGPNGHAVETWLGDLMTECVEICDPFGPTITDKKLSALVLSGETRAGGKAVNQKRLDQHWPEMEVFEVDVLDATEELGGTAGREDWKNKISSTALRKAEFERLKAKEKI